MYEIVNTISQPVQWWVMKEVEMLSDTPPKKWFNSNPGGNVHIQTRTHKLTSLNSILMTQFNIFSSQWLPLNCNP